MKDEDIIHRRAWSEVSGAPEKLMAKAGAKAVPAMYAGILTGKEILDINPDGYHYTRLIMGNPYEKIIYGWINVNAELAAKLQAAGIQLHDLPENFIKNA